MGFMFCDLHVSLNPLSSGDINSSNLPCSMFRCTLLFCNHIDGDERAGCFTLFVFLVSCAWYVALPQGAVEWYPVCDCGISWLYSLAFLYGWIPGLTGTTHAGIRM